ncbi:MAG: thermonuclease family protein [Rhizobiales bacterium]|nr:thermonuclease family protein [Hyphomicrobiales bacterium]
MSDEPNTQPAGRVTEFLAALTAHLITCFFLGLGFWLAFVVVIGAKVSRAEELTGRLHAIDGDTVWHYATPRAAPEKIRLLDIDAPESSRSACEREFIAGLRAKARLAELLLARPVRIERCDRHGQDCEDRFGRTLARIHTREGEIGAILLREGLALKYEAGRKATRNAHWCRTGARRSTKLEPNG